jgi:hypothetical protein
MTMATNRPTHPIEFFGDLLSQHLVVQFLLYIGIQLAKPSAVDLRGRRQWWLGWWRWQLRWRRRWWWQYW